MFDWNTLLTALIPSAVTLVGVLISNNGTKDLLSYRIEKLETAVNKHNNVIERVALLEQDSKAKWNRIDELKNEIERIKNDD